MSKSFWYTFSACTIFALAPASAATAHKAEPVFTPIAAPPTKPAVITSRDLTPDAIFKRYKDAVVRIEVTLHGASLGVGSGFFYSPTGEIATSLHVIRPFLVHPATELTIKLASGKVFRTVKIGACSDDRGIDLCLLKVDHSPKSILPLDQAEVTPGESIVAIGHPRGLDFSISTGIVSALRTHPSGWSEVQIDAAISPGNSGGPIINRDGEAVGLVYQFERDGQNLNFGILTSEADRMRGRSIPFLAAAAARKSFAEKSKGLARRFAAKWTKPAIHSFTNINSRPMGMKWMKAQLGATSFSMLLPDLFQSCERSDDSETTATACSSAGGDIVLTIQKRPRSLDGSLVSYRGKKLVESRALSIVERLESEGTWDEVNTNRASFMSTPLPARCFAFQKKSVVSTDETGPLLLRKKGFFQDASSLCRFETENDSEPGAVSTSQWVEVGNDFYGINVWAADPGRLPFLQGLGDLVLVSAGSSADETKPAAYRAHLRPSLKREQNPKSALITGADLTDFYVDDTSTVTIVRTLPVAPSQMNRQFLKWAMTVAKLPKTKPLRGEDVSSFEIAGNAARIGHWIVQLPMNRGTALLMAAASFGPRETWLIYEMQALNSVSGAGRAPSKSSAMDSIAADLERFRAWAEEFQPLP